MRNTIVMIAVLLTASASQADGLTPEEQKCFDAINALRVSKKLPPVEFDATLLDGCRSWSKMMEKTRRFQHAGFGGENIAMGNTDGLKTYNQWFKSPGHYAFMTSKSTTHAAVGQSGKYWTYRAVNKERHEKLNKKPEKITESTVAKTETAEKQKNVPSAHSSKSRLILSRPPSRPVGQRKPFGKLFR